jgi:hypothetical protein
MMGGKSIILIHGPCFPNAIKMIFYKKYKTGSWEPVFLLVSVNVMASTSRMLFHQKHIPV